jgi:molybdopterin synthase catalytic subunit
MEITIQFTASPIVIPPLHLPHREIGACVEFQGLVRELEQGQALPGLFYEAYLPMAERQMARIFESLAAEYPCHSVLFIHRLDWVPVGEVSIFLRVLASHRAEALALCGAAIDRMKQDAPIWKNLRIA